MIKIIHLILREKKSMISEERDQKDLLIKKGNYVLWKKEKCRPEGSWR